MLGLQFLRQGALTGEPALYVGFQENPVQLERVMRGLGWADDQFQEKGVFEILYRSPVEMRVDEVARAIFERIRQGKVKRIVIDALGDLRRRSPDPSRFSDFIYTLTQWFAVHQVTCLLTYELSDLFEFHRITGEEISNMSDNVLLLRFTPGSHMERTLRVVKTRGSAHDQDEHVLQITGKGVAILGVWKPGAKGASRS
jgi:circadian clock protein KaiC